MAAKSQSTVRRDAADMILGNLKEHSSDLVQQAVMVSEELIRVAILWHEQWHEALEEASRYSRFVIDQLIIHLFIVFHCTTTGFTLVNKMCKVC